MGALEQFKRIEEVWQNFTSTQAYYYQLGPWTMCVQFSNKALAEKLTTAFNHLKITPVAEPDLTIGLWDTRSEKQKLPPLDWKLIARNGYHGYADPPIYLHYFESINALSILNVAYSRAYYIVKDLMNLPWWVSGSPLQIILHAWLRSKGMQLTHTAAVGNGQQAVLLTGKGGSGKSTTTLACLTQGLNYLGEDYCLLAAQPEPKVYSIYQSAKWRIQTRNLFPHYEQYIANPDTANLEKALVYYQNIFPKQIKIALPIKASISLQVGSQNKPILKKYDSQLALKDLAVSTLTQLPLCHADSIRILQDVARELEHYQLLLGQDVAANAAMIKEILE